MDWRLAVRTFVAALAAILLAAPVAALVAPAAVPEAAEPSQEITPERSVRDDSLIADRIRGIFSELPRLAGIEVEVNEGVVTLSGTVADSADRQRAGAIAGRVAGVVTVENAIERDTTVGGATAGVWQVTEQFARIAAMLPLIAAALLVWIAIAAIGYLIAGIGGLWKRVARNGFLAELIAGAIRFAFVIGGLVVAFNMLGAGALMGAVLGGAGLAGIALGFAMRDTIENYVASLMLSLRQPFRANDHVVIDQHEGRVIRLTSRATILMTLDGNHLRIPNGAVFRAVIVNYSSNPQRRFDFTLQIDARKDTGEARRVGLEAIRSLNCILAEPAPVALLETVEHPFATIRYLAWIDQTRSDLGQTRSRAIAAVRRALAAAGLLLTDQVQRVRIERGEGEAPVLPAPESEDTESAPLEEPVARMVEQERAVSPKERDLLDPNRPVE